MNNQGRGGRVLHVTALVAILAIACILRFHALSGQGLLLFDEGPLIAEARSVQRIAACWAGTFSPAYEERTRAGRDLASQVSSSPLIFGKPAHNLLLAAFLSAIPRADLATLSLSAASGTLTVLLVYLLGRVLFGRFAGLLGALALAISPYHLLYSREGLSDSLTVLFWTASLLLWTGRGPVAALASGIAGGLCFATNYRELILPLLIALLAFHGGSGNRAGIGQRSRRTAVWLAGFLAATLAFELLYRAWTLAAGNGGASFPNGTYFGQLAVLLGFHGGQGFRFLGWWAFGYYTLTWEGAVSLAWLIAVLPFQFRRWKGADGILNISLLLPWLVFSAYWDNASRFFSVLLPLVAIAKGRWLAEGLGAVTRRFGSAAASVAGAAVFAACLPFIPPMVPRPAPYTVAAKFLSEAGASIHLSTNPRIAEAYLGAGSSIPFPPVHFGTILRFNTPIRYAVTDLQAPFGGFDMPDERFATAKWAVASFRTVMKEPYCPAAVRQYVLEQDLSFHDALGLLAEVERASPSLKILDLAKPIRNRNP